MLDPREPSRAVISDLGIAANEEEQGGITVTHEVVGTPTFRAPEALTGRHSTRSDVYSLGKTIEAALNGGVPIEIGPGKCLRDERLTPELWNAVDNLLSSACAFDPALRFEDAAALLKAFPLTVVGLRTPSERSEAVDPSSEIVLKVAERFALSEVISRCPSGEDWGNLEEIKRYSKLNEYYFSISVRRLESLKLIQTEKAEGDFGNTYSVVRPTSVGIKWADDHHEEMTAAMAEVAPKVAKGDDIPF
jgi:serine/threonine protein kinase